MDRLWMASLLVSRNERRGGRIRNSPHIRTSVSQAAQTGADRRRYSAEFLKLAFMKHLEPWKEKFCEPFALFLYIFVNFHAFHEAASLRRLHLRVSRVQWKRMHNVSWITVQVCTTNLGILWEKTNSWHKSILGQGQELTTFLLVATQVRLAHDDSSHWMQEISPFSHAKVRECCPSSLDCCSVVWEVVSATAVLIASISDFRRMAELFRSDIFLLWTRWTFSTLNELLSDSCASFEQESTSQLISTAQHLAKLFFLSFHACAHFSAVEGEMSCHGNLIFSLQMFSHNDIVVNCTGFGSQKLLNDDKMFTLRGHLIRVSWFTVHFWILFTVNTFVRRSYRHGIILRLIPVRLFQVKAPWLKTFVNAEGLYHAYPV